MRTDLACLRASRHAALGLVLLGVTAGGAAAESEPRPTRDECIALDVAYRLSMRSRSLHEAFGIPPASPPPPSCIDMLLDKSVPPLIIIDLPPIKQCPRPDPACQPR